MTKESPNPQCHNRQPAPPLGFWHWALFRHYGLVISHFPLRLCVKIRVYLCSFRRRRGYGGQAAVKKFRVHSYYYPEKFCFPVQMFRAA
jgi:hypothetical protein